MPVMTLTIDGMTGPTGLCLGDLMPLFGREWRLDSIEGSDVRASEACSVTLKLQMVGR